MRRTMLLAAVASIALAGSAAAATLEIATDQSPVGLDPHLATAFATVLVNSGVIYEGLTAVDRDLSIVPALAASWTISPDGLTYVFTLRDNAKFHDGSTLRPEDVIASFKRVMDPATGSPYASRINMITDMKVTGPHELTVTLGAPSAPLLSQLTTIMIVPEAAITGGVDLQKQPDGTGPFKFVEWVPDTYIAFAKNEGYWEAGLPRLDGVRFNIVPESSTRQVGLASGTYDMLTNIDSATALTLAGNPDVTLLETADLAYSLVGMNVSKPPFDDPKVREALNTGIDRAQIVEAVYFGKAAPGGPLSPALTAWALPVDQYPCYTPDPERAKALLAEAGHTEPVAFSINVDQSDLVVTQLAQVVQAQLNNAGFEVTLNLEEQGTFIQDWKNSNFDAFMSINGGNTDPDGYLYRTFHTTGSTNVFKYTNTNIDALLDQGRISLDPAERKTIYDQIQAMLACDGPIAHLAYGDLFTAIGKGVSGYEMVGNRVARYLRETDLAQ